MGYNDERGYYGTDDKRSFTLYNDLSDIFGKSNKIYYRNRPWRYIERLFSGNKQILLGYMDNAPELCACKPIDDFIWAP